MGSTDAAGDLGRPTRQLLPCPPWKSDIRLAFDPSSSRDIVSPIAFAFSEREAAFPAGRSRLAHALRHV